METPALIKRRGFHLLYIARTKTTFQHKSSPSVFTLNIPFILENLLEVLFIRGV